MNLIEKTHNLLKLLIGPRDSTDRAGSTITGQAAWLSDRERRDFERRQPGYTLSYRSTPGQSRAEAAGGMIAAAKHFSRGDNT